MSLRPRHPLLGLARLLALGWTLLSLLGVGLSLLAVLYGGAWGCVGHASGWFACTAATMLIPVAAFGSLFMAAVTLFFVHVFYVGGAESRRVAPYRTWGQRARGLLADVIVDVFD